MTTRIKFRRDTSGNWTSANPILAEGEPGLETDTHKLKYGNGTSTWTVLAYSSGGVEIGQDGQINIGDGTTTEGGYNSIAIGTEAGIGQMWSTVALGNQAGNDSQGASAIAIGRSAGESDQAWNGIAIGRYAGATNQDTASIAIGKNSGNFNQGQEAIAIGQNAGNFAQNQHAIAIGQDAGATSQNIAAIAIGEDAGNYQQSFRAIAIGRYAGNDSQGDQAVAVGALAGYIEQGDKAIAIGRHAGETFQSYGAIAIGDQAGRGVNPATTESVSSVNWVSGGSTGTTTFIANTLEGVYPGMSISGFSLNGFIFVNAINTLTNEITLSEGTPDQLSGSYSFFGSQGANSIAIGQLAGASVQHANSVVINATGNEVNSAGTGTVVIKTVRAVSSNAGFYPCYYNPETGELVYVTGV